MADNLNNDDLRHAFNELGNILARLQPQASAQMFAAHPDPREIATLVFQLIIGLRVLFPASETEPSFEPIGVIAERVVAPLRDQFNSKLD